jgi:hypothetical protein
MARVVPAPARKGSQFWLQHMVAHDPGALQPDALPPLEWLSPLAADDHAEYMDADFLHRLGLSHLAPALADFWPRSGPRWDGLARAGKAVVLVEAKSHLAEALSSPCAASPASLARIRRALDDTRAALRGDDRSDWSRVFYQYANRLAHLHWLRAQGVQAHLLLVGFVGDVAMKGPATAAEWHAIYLAAHHAMGLVEGHPLARFVHHVHPSCPA